ncbi:MAG: hypothetical protein ABFC73_10615 [Clostridiaceae bacterium]
MKLNRISSFIIAVILVFVLLPSGAAHAAGDPAIALGSAEISGNTYYYSNAIVSGDNIQTILISFSESVSAGDEIILPTPTPAGFTISASSSSNDYTKRINLTAGIADSVVQEYIRGIGFTISSPSQTVSVSVTTENIIYDTYYNIETQHYYQYVPDTSSSWIQAYNTAKSMTYMGRNGYLATVMSKEEDIYINKLSDGKTGWLGGTILLNSGSMLDAAGTTSGALQYYSDIDTSSFVTTGWYWACGPEIGTTFYGKNSLFPDAGSSNAATTDAANSSSYYNWARGTVSYEPNNQTAYVPYTNIDYETCLTTLVINNNSGKSGTSFSWNDKQFEQAGTGTWQAKGYFIEYGNQAFGDNSAISTAFASDSDSLLRLYTATVNIKQNGLAVDATGAVTLRQSGSTVATATNSGTGIYTAEVSSGTYDVYIGSENTGNAVIVNNAPGSATVNYYTVSFSVSNAGTASGSTISATVNSAAISSGTAVLAGKTVEITAVGAGATSYTYAWTGSGTSSETTAALTKSSLSGAVDATCTINGTTVLVEPEITIPPSGKTAAVGKTATFSATATGSPLLVYQWQINRGSGWNDISGADEASYTTAKVELLNDGYQYRVVVTNTVGSDTSDPASLHVVKDAEVPTTGDAAHPVLWAAFGLLSLAGLCALAFAVKKRRA